MRFTGTYNRFTVIELAGDFWNVCIINSNRELVKGILVTRSYKNAWLALNGAYSSALRQHLGADYC